MKLLDFDYYLPEEFIAQYPADTRDSSRLLVLDRKTGTVQHSVFRDIVRYLKSGDVLVLNNTKVVPARIYCWKPTGGKAEVLLIREVQENVWEVITRRIHEGRVIFRKGMKGMIIRGNNGKALLEFNGKCLLRDVIHEIGDMPLPPYIKRKTCEIDNKRYQTVYAEKNGAIAAPTAGLHFTEKILEKIRAMGVYVYMLTLHVGYGTFKPVITADISRHRMDEEFYEIPYETAYAINRARSEGRRVIAVGTTVTRALESSAEMDGLVRGGQGEASLFIFPGYKFKIVDALLTNFHLPKSTPIMLTSAFCGLQNLKKAYSEAINRKYRFYSYGDAMFIM
jgi:S-adenosylmethionine:tRNA ribosyltransferase-isomerase